MPGGSANRHATRLRPQHCCDFLWRTRPPFLCLPDGWEVRACGRLLTAASDRRDQHDLVAVLEGIGLAAEKADVFVVDVDVDEAAKLAVFAFDLRGERRKGLVDVSKEAGEICSGRIEVFAAIGVACKSGGERGLYQNFFWSFGGKIRVFAGRGFSG